MNDKSEVKSEPIDEQIEVNGGQVVVVPAGVAHKFVNSGDLPSRPAESDASTTATNLFRWKPLLHWLTSIERNRRIS